MNILYVTLGYPPAKGLGGPTKNAYEITRELASRGHQVTVFCTNLHQKGKKISSNTFEDVINNVRVIYLDTWTWKKWPGTVGPFFMPDIKKYVDTTLKGFDIIHINGYRDNLASYIAKQARKYGIPYIIQPRGELPYLGWTGYIKRFFDFFFRSILLNASTLIALSPKEKNECLSLSKNQTHVEILTNGVNISKDYMPLPPKGKLRSKADVAENIPIILFLGRLNWIKGPDILIKAYVQTKRQATLLLIGPNNGYEDEVQAIIKENKLEDQVKLIEGWDPKSIMEVFVDVDICVMTSRKELFPMTMVEACIAGVPLVLTDTIEVSSLVANQAALVTPLDPKAIAVAIDQLLDDEELRIRFSHAGQRIAQETFSITSVVDRLEKIYVDAIKRN